VRGRVPRASDEAARFDLPWTLRIAGASERLKEPTRLRILARAEKHYAGKYARLDIRFKGALC
jgi:hypothetical protein